MYYNLSKTAEILGMTTGDVNRLREQGKLRAFKDGADWKFRKEDVEKYLTNMIKERSRDGQGDSLLTSEDDDEDKTMFAADSAAFDAMFDKAGDELAVSAKVNEPDDEELALATEGDAFALAPESDDDFSLAPESDAADDFVLAPESSDSSVGGLNLAKEADADSALASDPNAVDLAASGSDDNLSLSNSDSGLSLLGDSSVDLTGADDIVLGGSGSGDGLNLSNSDSGLSLASDSDGGFELVADVSDGALSLAKEDDEASDFALAKDDGDDSVFELAAEASSSAQILNLDQNADSDAATELAADESVFELSTETSAPDSSESMSSSVFSTEDPAADVSSPFSLNSETEDDGVFALAEDPTPAAAKEDNASSSVLLDLDDSAADDPFMTEESSDSPFAASESSTVELSGFDGSDGFGGASDSPFGAGGLNFDKPDDSGSSPFDMGMPSDSAFGATPTYGDEPSFAENQNLPAATAVSSTQYTGKDLIFLVPCLLFLILATIGAVELCRTIWSYQEGSFTMGGPLLEAIAKMIKLM